MEASGDGDLNAVAMPGFIDILSSVITVFMFFMLITSAVMFFLSMKIKKDAQEEVKQAKDDAKKKEAEAKDAMTKEMKDLLEKLKNNQITIEQLSQMIAAAADKKGGQDDSDQKKSGASASNAQSQSTANSERPADQNGEQALSKFSKSAGEGQKSSVDAQSNDMIITFSKNSISVTDQTAKVIDAYLDGYEKRTGKTASKVTLESSDNPDSSGTSLAREVELGRTLNVRNVLLDKKVAPEGITIKNNIAPVQQNGTYDWVKIHVE